jgi:hypothetical protein
VQSYATAVSPAQTAPAPQLVPQPVAAGVSAVDDDIPF